MGYFTEQEGFSFPFSTDACKLYDPLVSEQVKYVLVDKKHPKVQEYLLPATQTHEDKFSLVQELEQASLYEFSSRSVAD